MEQLKVRTTANGREYQDPATGEWVTGEVVVDKMLNGQLPFEAATPYYQEPRYIEPSWGANWQQNQYVSNNNRQIYQQTHLNNLMRVVNEYRDYMTPDRVVRLGAAFHVDDTPAFNDVYSSFALKQEDQARQKRLSEATQNTENMGRYSSNPDDNSGLIGLANKIDTGYSLIRGNARNPALPAVIGAEGLYKGMTRGDWDVLSSILGTPQGIKEVHESLSGLNNLVTPTPTSGPNSPAGSRAARYEEIARQGDLKRLGVTNVPTVPVRPVAPVAPTQAPAAPAAQAQAPGPSAEPAGSVPDQQTLNTAQGPTQQGTPGMSLADAEAELDMIYSNPRAFSGAPGKARREYLERMLGYYQAGLYRPQGGKTVTVADIKPGSPEARIAQQLVDNQKDPSTGISFDQMIKLYPGLSKNSAMRSAIMEYANQISNGEYSPAGQSLQYSGAQIDAQTPAKTRQAGSTAGARKRATLAPDIIDKEADLTGARTRAQLAPDIQTMRIGQQARGQTAKTLNNQRMAAQRALSTFDDALKTNGTYENIPEWMYRDLASDYAKILVSSGQIAEGSVDKVMQASAQGDLAKAWNYMTGDTKTTAPTKVLKLMHDRIRALYTDLDKQYYNQTQGTNIPVNSNEATNPMTAGSQEPASRPVIKYTRDASGKLVRVK